EPVVSEDERVGGELGPCGPQPDLSVTSLDVGAFPGVHAHQRITMVDGAGGFGDGAGAGIVAGFAGHPGDLDGGGHESPLAPTEPADGGVDAHHQTPTRMVPYGRRYLSSTRASSGSTP